MTLVLPLAACATDFSRPSPDGLTPQAVALADAVKLGCMPFALGEKSEAAAMNDGGLRRQIRIPSYPAPPFLNRQYKSDGPGEPLVTIYGPGCTVRARGSDVAAFNLALDRVYVQRFGRDYAGRAPPAQPTDDQFPGMKRFCAAGHIFQSYPDPPDSIGRHGFNVMISPEPPSYCTDLP
jgi:hypothetical protein